MRLTKLAPAKVAPTRRERQLLRRAHRFNRATVRPTFRGSVRPSVLLAQRLAEARGELGRAKSRVSAWEERVARLERAVARARGAG